MALTLKAQLTRCV